MEARANASSRTIRRGRRATRRPPAWAARGGAAACRLLAEGAAAGVERARLPLLLGQVPHAVRHPTVKSGLGRRDLRIERLDRRQHGARGALGAGSTAREAPSRARAARGTLLVLLEQVRRHVGRDLDGRRVPPDDHGRGALRAGGLAALGGRHALCGGGCRRGGLHASHLRILRRRPPGSRPRRQGLRHGIARDDVGLKKASMVAAIAAADTDPAGPNAIKDGPRGVAARHLLQEGLVLRLEIVCGRKRLLEVADALLWALGPIRGLVRAAQCRLAEEAPLHPLEVGVGPRHRPGE